MANSFKNLVRTGFGLGLGVMAAQIVFILVGMAFFIPGFIIYTKAKKQGQKGSSEQISGIVLMAVGVVIMGGLGFGLLTSDISDMF